MRVQADRRVMVDCLLPWLKLYWSIMVAAWVTDVVNACISLSMCQIQPAACYWPPCDLAMRAKRPTARFGATLAIIAHNR